MIVEAWGEITRRLVVHPDSDQEARTKPPCTNSLNHRYGYCVVAGVDCVVELAAGVVDVADGAAGADDDDG